MSGTRGVEWNGRNAPQNRRPTTAVLTAVMLTAVAATAQAIPTPPEASFMFAAQRSHERRPQRSTSLEWTSDVQERLRALDAHGKAALRARLQMQAAPIPPGRSTPLPPDADDGWPR